MRVGDALRERVHGERGEGHDGLAWGGSVGDLALYEETEEAEEFFWRCGADECDEREDGVAVHAVREGVDGLGRGRGRARGACEAGEGREGDLKGGWGVGVGVGTHERGSWGI
jgi:hypothetical protein